MNYKINDISEQKARENNICFGCGKEKQKGHIVCCDCFEGKSFKGQEPFKDTEKSLKIWAKSNSKLI